MEATENRFSTRTHLKNVFWPHIFVGASRVPAKPSGEDGIWKQNPIFEMGSKQRGIFVTSVAKFKHIIGSHIWRTGKKSFLVQKNAVAAANR